VTSRESRASCRSHVTAGFPCRRSWCVTSSFWVGDDDAVALATPVAAAAADDDGGGDGGVVADKNPGSADQVAGGFVLRRLADYDP